MCPPPPLKGISSYAIPIPTHLFRNNITWITQPSYHTRKRPLTASMISEAEKKLLKTWLLMSLTTCINSFSWKSEQVLRRRRTNLPRNPGPVVIVVRLIKLSSNLVCMLLREEKLLNHYVPYQSNESTIWFDEISHRGRRQAMFIFCFATCVFRVPKITQSFEEVF